jgi:hypothetical protein
MSWNNEIREQLVEVLY